MVVEVPLSKGKTTLIDRDDFERVAKHKWCFCPAGKGYAVRGVLQPDGKTKTVYLHRFILDAPDGVNIDHINGDTLDNTSKNLRQCSQKQNLWNQRSRWFPGKGSRFKGVYKPRRNKNIWAAGICVGGMRFHLGLFGCEEDAARAYDEAAKKHFGEFASLNFGM